MTAFVYFLCPSIKFSMNYELEGNRFCKKMSTVFVLNAICFQCGMEKETTLSYLIRGFENILGKHTKCVSQTHKTWFYYDYTTNANNSKTAKGILSFDEAISAEKIRKRCFHCWQLHVMLWGACQTRLSLWNMIPIIRENKILNFRFRTQLGKVCRLVI